MVRDPGRLQHFFPVLLALFCLGLSLSNDDYYEGFSEGQPATWLSLILIGVCLLLVAGALRIRDLELARRRTAWVLLPILVVALLDEAFGGHEEIGRFVQRRARFLPREVRHYTDDALIILGAVLGTWLLFRCVRAVRDRRSFLPYLALIALFAVAHGVFDLLGHGRYLWKAVLPEMSTSQVKYVTDVMSFFEESCKLWTEWFVIQFLLLFFHRRRGAPGWSLLVVVGFALAPWGLWALLPEQESVPYLFVGGDREYIRNHHLLLGLAAIWLAWTVASWRAFSEDPFRRTLAGLFFVVPFYLLLPRMAVFEWLVARPAQGPTTGRVAVVAVLGALALGAWSVRRRIGLGPACLAAVPLGLSTFSASGLPAQPRLLITVGGLLFPLALVLALRDRSPRGRWVVGVVGAVGLVQSPLWLVAALGLALIEAIRGLDRQQLLSRRRALPAALLLHAVTVAGIFSVSSLALLPKMDYSTAGQPRFSVGRQAIAVDPRDSRR